MSKPVTEYRHLARKPGSSCKQLFIEGRRISARTLYGMYMSAEEPRTVEEIASDFQLPVEAVREAIEWCASDPPELRRDIARDEAIMKATGMNDIRYWTEGRRWELTPEEQAEIARRFAG